MEETLWIGQLLNDVEEVPLVALQGHVELRVDGFDLTICRALAKRWRNEELGQPVETFLETIVRAVEMIIGVSEGGESIVHSTVVLHKLRIFVLSWILFGTLEQHVLEKMSGSV